jgi:hypothetical protein
MMTIQATLKYLGVLLISSAIFYCYIARSGISTLEVLSAGSESPCDEERSRASWAEYDDLFKQIEHWRKPEVCHA